MNLRFGTNHIGLVVAFEKNWSFTVGRKDWAIEVVHPWINLRDVEVSLSFSACFSELSTYQGINMGPTLGRVLIQSCVVSVQEFSDVCCQVS